VKTPVLVFLLLPVAASAASSSLQFVPGGNIAAQGVLPLSGGKVAVFGAMVAPGCTAGLNGSCNQTTTPLLAVLDSSGNLLSALATSALGGGNSSISASATDASGNIWIAGQTDSDNFPLVQPLFSQKPDYQAIGFVAKLDPGLNILFSTFFGAPGASSPIWLAVDSSGNAYITGSTVSAGFPTTGPILGSPGSSNNPASVVIYTFVSKISPDGGALLFSRLLGGDGSSCMGGSACIGSSADTVPSAIAVAGNGAITVGGSTNATNFPVTANVYTTPGGAFVSRISADGSQLIWSTEIGSSAGPGPYFVYSSIKSIAVDTADSVYIAGIAPAPITTTPNALQPTILLGSQVNQQNGFTMKLSSDATQVLFATNLGGSTGATLSGLTLDGAGNVWISGNTNSSNFPGLSIVPSSGVDFALELNANATAIQQIFDFVPATVTQSPAFDSNGNLLLLASAGNLLRLNPSTALSSPAVLAVTNSAVAREAVGVGSGELVTLYGVGLGPSTPIAGEPDQNGLYPTQLGGVTVTFGGGGLPSVPAPLLYAAPGQINLQVPFNILSTNTVTVMTPNGPLPALQLQENGSLGIFGVVNQDGTVNSAANPGPQGSIVSLYITGLGAPSPTAQNGQVSVSANSFFSGQVEVTLQGSFYPLSLLYAGTAPTLINGLDQVAVQLPAGVPNPLLEVMLVLPPYGTFGPATSNVVVVYTQ